MKTDEFKSFLIAIVAVVAMTREIEYEICRKRVV